MKDDYLHIRIDKEKKRRLHQKAGFAPLSAIARLLLDRWLSGEIDAEPDGGVDDDDSTRRPD